MMAVIAAFESMALGDTRPITVAEGVEELPLEAYVPVSVRRVRWLVPIAPVSPADDAFGAYGLVACGVRAMYGESGEPEEIAWYTNATLCGEPFRKAIERAFFASRVHPTRHPARVGVAIEIDFTVPRWRQERRNRPAVVPGEDALPRLIR